MTKDPRLERLIVLAELMRETEMARLRAAARALEQSRAQFAALSTPATDPSSVARARAALRHETWAAPRRAAVNRQMARQMAEWLATRESARRAFGRAQVLRGFGDR